MYAKSSVGVCRSVMRRCFSIHAKPSPSISESQRIIEKENKYGAFNYHPLPVVLNKGKGIQRLN